MTSVLNHGKLIPPLGEDGIDNLVGAPYKGIGIQVFDVTLAGAAPHTITFVNQLDPSGRPVKNMAGIDYKVFTGGESAARTQCDLSTRTATGFQLLGGADTEVVQVMVVGQIANMKR
jgi:hypothetical protein